MIKINYDKKWKDLINKKMLKEILNIFIKELFETELELSLYITDDFEIQKLNKTFRNKNSPTDILSWAYNDNNFEIGVNCRSPLGGEIVISGDSARILSTSQEQTTKRKRPQTKNAFRTQTIGSVREPTSKPRGSLKLAGGKYPGRISRMS